MLASGHQGLTKLRATTLYAQRVVQSTIVADLELRNLELRADFERFATRPTIETEVHGLWTDHDVKLVIEDSRVLLKRGADEPIERYFGNQAIKNYALEGTYLTWHPTLSIGDFVANDEGRMIRCMIVLDGLEHTLQINDDASVLSTLLEEEMTRFPNATRNDDGSEGEEEAEEEEISETEEEISEISEREEEISD